jgi:hypothetical protein
MSGDLFCQPGVLLFECLADQNPFSLRWIITLCVIEAHRDPSPNWLAQHMGLLVASVQPMDVPSTRIEARFGRELKNAAFSADSAGSVGKASPSIWL